MTHGPSVKRFRGHVSFFLLPSGNQHFLYPFGDQSIFFCNITTLYPKNDTTYVAPQNNPGPLFNPEY